VFYQTISTNPAVVNHIFGMDFDGGGLQDLSARAGGGYSDTDPDWSPDGQRIVFVRTPRAGAPEIWVMNRDGTGARRVVRLTGATGVTGEYSPTPRWSPDGGRIAYAAVARVATPGAPLYPSIFTIGVNGEGERQLTDNDLINTGPVWSPDGAQLAWAAKDFIKRENWRTWMMNASGSDQRIVYGAPAGDPNNGSQPAAWRGIQLLISGWTGNWNAYVGSAEGGTLTRITSGRSDTIPTDWLP
jgi:Tol biopolymer transport system component